MFGFGSERTAKRLRELEERVATLEYQLAEDRLRILDTAERISHKLRDRTAKRREPELELEEGDAEYDHALGFARRFRSNQGGS